MSAPGDHKNPGTSPLEFDNVARFDDFINSAISMAISPSQSKKSATPVLPEITLKPKLFIGIKDWHSRLLNALIYVLSNSDVPFKNIKINAQVDATTQIELTRENWKESVLKLAQKLYPEIKPEQLAADLNITPRAKKVRAKLAHAPKPAGPAAAPAPLPPTPKQVRPTAPSPKPAVENKASQGAARASTFEHRLTAAFAKASRIPAIDSQAEEDPDSEIDRTPPTPPNTPKSSKS